MRFYRSALHGDEKVSAKAAATQKLERSAMRTMNQYCRELFGEKVYKISLNGGFTCPNRDGTLGRRGCIFCSAGGSGDFAPEAALPIDTQIELAKKRVAEKFRGERYIAYFQAFTNTYAPVQRLRGLYFPVIEREDIAALSIATRPDCLGEDVLELLAELNAVKPVWVELGLQSVHERTAEYIRRGYPLEVYDRAVERLKGLDIHCVSHVILGLPGESTEDMLDTVRHVVGLGGGGIKLQLLHVLEGTDLADDYRAGLFETLSLEEYVEILKKCAEIIPEDMVVHRLTGDGPKRSLIAPLWSGDKKRVINSVNRALGL